MKKNIVIGTAGHIDHGKTSLVKALTGIDTDRLEEEKKRGITIDLGFANLSLSEDINAGIVDVPGHEKFIKNMVAGAFGIDIVILVIAADESVMPQTREHMDICQLLGINKGLIAVTKVDTVDEELLELCLDDINEFIKDTFLEGCSLIPVSSITGQGILEIKNEITKIAEKTAQKKSDGLLFIPIDRAFIMKGFGTVATGTVVSGRINEGNLIDILPTETNLLGMKVRGLHVHNNLVQQVTSGQRTAVNVQGLEKEYIKRGMIITEPDKIRPTYMLDVKLNILNNIKKPLLTRSKVIVNTGTSQLMAYLILLGTKQASPGSNVFAQIRLSEPICALKNQYFIIRGFKRLENYGNTIGGGIILDPAPKKHKTNDKIVIQNLNILEGENKSAWIEVIVKEGNLIGKTITEVIRRTNIPDKELNQLLSKLYSSKTILKFNKEKSKLIHTNVINKLKTKFLNYIEAYHKENNLKEYMKKEELRSKLPFQLDVKLFNLIIENLSHTNEIKSTNEDLKLYNHKIVIEQDILLIKTKVLNIIENSYLTPPTKFELKQKMPKADINLIITILVKEDLIINLTKDLFYSIKCLNNFKQILIKYLKEHKEISAQDYKNLVGASRKFTIPIAEYFDKQKITLRIDNKRILRGDY